MDLIHKLRTFEPLFSKRPEPAAPSPSGIHCFVPGREITAPLGRFYQTENSIGCDYTHGQISIRSLFENPPSVYDLVGRDPALAGIDFRKTVFLDTETTGLAGGTGTVPFLIGLGFLTDDGFRIEQYFMRDYDEEPAVLSAVRDRLESFQFLVSYNGKGYDVSLLSARFILSRMRNPVENRPHLDLLFAARRLWKRRLGDCSLSNVERTVLGFTRENDVPGFFIPHLYFEYLRTRNAKPLAPVFRHNQWDILALVALAALAGEIYQNPSEHLDHPLDFLSLGRAMERLFRMEEAAACFRKALDHPLENEEREEALFRLGLAWKRLGRWDQAVQVWEYAAAHLPFSVLPYEELAKYHEHKAQDFAKAISWTERALERIAFLEELNTELLFEIEKQDLETRLNRLKRKG